MAGGKTWRGACGDPGMPSSAEYATDLTDAQWALLAPELPVQHGPGRPREVDLRPMLDGLRYLNRTGCQWRWLPKDFGPWTTVRYSFDKWGQDGTPDHLNTVLRERVRRRAGRAAQPTAAVVDTQSVKTTEVGGERGFDGGKKSHRAQAVHPGRHARAAGGQRLRRGQP